MSKINGWKTYFLGVSAIIAAIAGYINGALDLTHMIEAIFAAVGTMTIRHGITTKTSEATDKKL